MVKILLTFLDPRDPDDKQNLIVWYGILGFNVPGILLVNFLCTDSMEIMSFFSVGDHSGLLYSRIGRAYVMKALTNKSRCLEAKQRWIKLAR